MASSSMCGACNMAATRRAMVVLPEQLGPMITTRSNLIRAHDQRSASPSDAIGEAAQRLQNKFTEILGWSNRRNGRDMVQSPGDSNVCLKA